MTLQEAISDVHRPLSMTPKEWMQYAESKEQEEHDNFDSAVNVIYAEEMEDNDNKDIGAEEKLEIGIEQMVLGCRIAMRALNELERKDISKKDRKAYDGIGNIVSHAIAPYLADIMKFRKELYD